MRSIIGIIIWIFFVTIYGIMSNNMYERRECIVGIKISYRIARICGFSGKKKKISVFVLIYQMIYIFLTVSSIILLFAEFNKIWEIIEVYIYLSAFNAGLCATLYSITRIVIHKGID